MKKLDVSSITDTAEMPVKSGTLQFLQDAHTENADALAKFIINLIGVSYDPTKFYILFGCVNTGAGLAYSISAGAIYYNGEIFLVDAAAFTASTGNVAIGVITTTQYTTNADPVMFTDSTSRNVHNIRKIVFQQGTPGTGDVQYSALVPLQINVPAQLNPTGTDFTISGTYPNLVFQPKVPYPFYSGSIHIGDIAGYGTTPPDPNLTVLPSSVNTFSAFKYTFPSGYTTSYTYMVMGVLVNHAENSVAGMQNNQNCVLFIGELDNNGFYFAVSAYGMSSPIQDLYLDFVLFRTA